MFFFFNDTATPEIYTYLHTLSLHDALPIYPLLHLVQNKRMGPTRHMQSLQKLIQDRIIGTLLESGTELQSPPLAVRLLDRFPLLRRIPARIVGLGFGREHIRSPSS